MGKKDKQLAALIRAADALATRTLYIEESHFGTFVDAAVKAAVKYKSLRKKWGDAGQEGEE